MLGWFNEKPIKKLLNIPGKKRIGLLITVGYPPADYTTRSKKRKGFEEILSWNSYSIASGSKFHQQDSH
jgi:nitroreductase